MKILFAVSNENVSNKIVDSYRKKYGEAVSFKNVFYFNAIIRELQKDKEYDRVVISEDLEPFSNSNYDVIDKFILERIQEISYQTETESGKKIDIIIICTDRRTKSSYVLSKMYEYGVYNALIGGDRRIDNVCDLIYQPRTADEARAYYKIENVESDTNIDDVTEQEVQNILIHYKRLGKNEDRYADSFNNIAAQYTDNQLKVIIKCLPINVRAVLEAECPRYQELVTSFGETEKEKKEKEKIQEQRRIEQIENEKKLKNKIEREKREAIRNAQRNSVQAQNQTAINNSGIDLLDNRNNHPRMTGNVIIPNSMDIRNERKIYSEDDLTELSSQQRPARTISEPVQAISEPVKVAKPETNYSTNSVLPGIEIPETINTPEPSLPGFEDLDDISLPEVEVPKKEVVPTMEDIAVPVVEENEPVQQKLEEVIPAGEEAPKKRGRGRPRKYPVEPPKPKGKRGRPRKNPLPEEVQPVKENKISDAQNNTNTEIPQLPGFDNLDEQPVQSTSSNMPNNNSVELPGFEDFEPQTNSTTNMNAQPTNSVELPGFEDFNNTVQESNTTTQSSSLPGLDLFDEPVTKENTNTNDLFSNNTNNSYSANENNGDILSSLPGIDDDIITSSNSSNNYEDPFAPSTSYTQQPTKTETSYSLPGLDLSTEQKSDNISNHKSYTTFDQKKEEALKQLENRTYSTGSLNNVLTKDKKIVAFVGASKNGTSFLVNNLACLFSSIGIKTAILDMTQNKNSYYIYTNNDEKLRNIAYTSIENLENGMAEGIKVDRNLEIYTSVPNDGKDYSNSEAILSTLIQNESLVLIDCDFNTDPGYFANAQEIYLVQSMDILTIQPLTAFLRDLKTKGILDPEKLRVVINKELKVRNLTSKAVIGGMSFYNDPAMSYMTELFSKDKIKACTIPFDDNVYSKYLEAMVNCVVTISGYTKNFMNSLKILGNMVYPLLSKQTYGTRPGESTYGSNFSSEMNSTLNQMRNKY